VQISGFWGFGTGVEDGVGEWDGTGVEDGVGVVVKGNISGSSVAGKPFFTSSMGWTCRTHTHTRAQVKLGNFH
jgi:hypothetical protein